MHSYTDFDELIQRCRSKNARSFIKEAIDCYRIGAYRACVITTWIALVYDFVDKLRELAITGDAAAKTKVLEFEAMQKNRDTDAALKFEREVLGVARNEFELISAQEMADLARLFDDRNRCGHPNLNGDADVYSPPAELARLHLRVAVEHVLSKAPVQGKAALESVYSTVDSDYFPITISEAKEILKSSPLGNAKKKLVEDFFAGCLLSLMREPLTSRKRMQRSSALSAVQQMYVETIRNLLSSKMGRFVTETKDAWLSAVVSILCAHPEYPAFLDAASLTRLRNYVKALPRAELSVLQYALNIDALRDAAIERLDSCPEPDLYSMATKLSRHPSDEFIERCIQHYQKASKPNHAVVMANSIILPLLVHMNSEQAKLVIAAGANKSVSGSLKFGAVVRSVLQLEKLADKDVRKILIKIGLQDVADVHVPQPA